MFFQTKRNRTNDKVWEMRFDCFIKWLQDHPDRLPRIRALSSGEESKAANWFNNQKTACKHNNLSEFRLNKLLTIPSFKEIYERTIKSGNDRPVY